MSRYISLPPLSQSQKNDLERAKKYAMEQNIKDVLLKQALKHQQHQITTSQGAAQKQRALAIMCRVYVGSIYYDIKQDMVREAFLPFGPIKSIDMSYDPITQKHKGYCFIDYELPEAAHLATEQMQSATLAGRTIKVGRPSNIGQAQPIIEQLAKEAIHFNRIYVASIHPELEESDLRSVFEAFGKIVNCQMDRDAVSRRHRGYAFIEYEVLQSATDAIASMNMFDLGGQFLRVGKAITPPNTHYEMASNKFGPSSNHGSALPAAAAVAAAAVTSKIMAQEAAKPSSFRNPALLAASGMTSAMMGASAGIGSFMPPPGIVVPPAAVMAADQPGVVTGATLAQQSTYHHQQATIAAPANAKPTPAIQQMLGEDALLQVQNGKQQSLSQQEGNVNISGSSQRHLMMQKLMRKETSRVMVLRNMVQADEIDDDLEGEVTEECGKHGPVERVIIYQEKQSEEEHAPIIVKIFVEFTSAEGCERAVESLDGRWFGGNKISAKIYPQELYDNQEYTE